jgi:hypothetical protein
MTYCKASSGMLEEIMSKERPMRVIGKDAEGIARVWGDGRTHEDASHEAQMAATEYVKRRPDTGPLRAWTFHPEPNR